MLLQSTCVEKAEPREVFWVIRGKQTRTSVSTSNSSNLLAKKCLSVFILCISVIRKVTPRKEVCQEVPLLLQGQIFHLGIYTLR